MRPQGSTVFLSHVSKHMGQAQYVRWSYIKSVQCLTCAIKLSVIRYFQSDCHFFAFLYCACGYVIFVLSLSFKKIRSTFCLQFLHV